MERTSLLGVLGLLTTALSQAQTYTHPTIGMQSTYTGTCLVSTCSGTYYDNGGAAGNYGPNVNAIFRTFCPNAPGMCVRATFTSFNMNDTWILCGGPGGCCDYLQVLNGPAQNSPALYNNCIASPGTITANNPSGCLTFRFVSDGTVQLGGWAATLSCVPCGIGPTGTTNADCAFATPVCSDQAIADASNGPGISAEGCAGCNTSEYYTNWYRIQIQTSGTLAFTINPNNNLDDFDPVVYGPNVSCATLGPPVRCSYAIGAGNGNTGLGNGAVDPSEDVFGDQWVSQMNVTAGQTYYVLINGWSATSGSNGFLMDWTGTAGLNCVILPVELTALRAACEESSPVLQWTTASEHANSGFFVQRSGDGMDFKDIGWVNGAGQSTQSRDYAFIDREPLRQGLSFYRLRQIDMDGVEELSEVVYVKDCTGPQADVRLFPNPAENSMEMDIDVGYPYDGSAAVDLQDALGRTIASRRVTLSAGRALLKMDVTALASGSYTVIVRPGIGEGSVRARLVKR